MLLWLPDLCKNAKFIFKEKTLKKTIIALKSTYFREKYHFFFVYHTTVTPSV